MVEAFIYESLEENGAQSQQTQHQQSGNDVQSQSQSQEQQGVNGVQQQTQVQSQGNAGKPGVMPSNNNVPFHKIVTMLLIFVFLAITFITEFSSGSVSKKMALMMGNNKIMMIFILLLIFYVYILIMRYGRNVSEEDMKKYKVTERHANVALILIVCELIGLRFTSYWLVWLATFFNV
tara:strand:- start:326 stop:859 length:534 start_codon:yes stop_codon:yes gene_type:complete